MIDFYTSSTGNGRRAAIALEECGLAHTVHRLDLAKGDAKQPSFLKINPAGMIPVIIDPAGPGGKAITVTQSGAIVLYCAEKSGKLLPKDPVRRIEAYEWFMQGATDLAPSSSALFYASTHAPDKSAANMAYYQQRFLANCAIADARLKGRDFFAADFSIADVTVYPVALARKAVIDEAPGLANFKAWMARVAARPAIAKALAANG